MKKQTRRLANTFSGWLQRPSTLILLAVLIAGAYFRFFNTPDRFGFDKDPTRDALVAIYGSDNLQFPLIGPFSGIANFTFGPWYYYELILSRLILQTEYAPFYLIGISSLTMIILMYILGKKFRDNILGLILAGLTAFSPAQTTATAGLSNPNLVSPHAAATILFFVLFLTRKLSLWWSLAWGFIVGVGINHHFQMLPLLILPLIAYLYKWRESLRHSGVFLAGITVAFIPLLFFNLLNEWHTVKGFTQFLLQGGTSYAPNSWTIYLRYFWPQFWAYVLGVPHWFGIIFGVFVVGINGFLLIKKKIDKPYLLILVSFLIMFVVLRYYGGNREYYYLFYLHPFLFLLAGVSLRYLWNEVIGKVALLSLGVAFFLFSFPLNQIRLSDRDDQQIFRNEAAFLTQRFPNEAITVYNCKDAAINHPEGLAFFLYRMNKLDDDGRKIATIDVNTVCDLPEGSGEAIAKGIYDFSKVSVSELNEKGWWSVTPESVYKKTALWWVEVDEK